MLFCTYIPRKYLKNYYLFARLQKCVWTKLSRMTWQMVVAFTCPSSCKDCRNADALPSRNHHVFQWCMSNLERQSLDLICQLKTHHYYSCRTAEHQICLLQSCTGCCFQSPRHIYPSPPRISLQRIALLEYARYTFHPAEGLN